MGAESRDANARNVPGGPADVSGGSGPASRELLATAETLLASMVPGTDGLWPRAATFLVRMGLEQAIADLWAEIQPGLLACPMRVQLLCLERYTDAELARRASAAWHGLSQAVHYHTYELAPTAGELRRWHDEVARVTERLREAR